MKRLLNFNSLLETIFPRSCIECGVALEDDEKGTCLCKKCRKQLIKIEPPRCPLCGGPLAGVVVEPRCCPSCVALDPAFQEGRNLFHMAYGARALVLALKYRRSLYVLREMEQLVRANPDFTEYLAGAVLVPVPLHRSRQQRRGFNQSLLIAEVFSRVAAGARVQDLLKRVKHTATQTRLSREARAKNVKGAFAFKGAASQTLDPQRRYLLIDDVLTTGATLDASARVLLAKGAQKVGIATFCHG